MYKEDNKLGGRTHRFGSMWIPWCCFVNKTQSGGNGSAEIRSETTQHGGRKAEHPSGSAGDLSPLSPERKSYAPPGDLSPKSVNTVNGVCLSGESNVMQSGCGGAHWRLRAPRGLPGRRVAPRCMNPVRNGESGDKSHALPDGCMDFFTSWVVALLLC